MDRDREIVVNPHHNTRGWYAAVYHGADRVSEWLPTTWTRAGSIRKARRWIRRHDRLALRQQSRIPAPREW